VGKIVFQNEKEILQNVADGDEQSFSILYQKISPFVYGVAFNLLKDKFLAEDIVQEVFVKLWSGKSGLTEIENIENYVFIITRNVVFSAFKKVIRESKAISVLHRKSESAHHSDSSGKLEEKEYYNILNTAIQLLPPQQKQVYLLAEESEMTYEQIAVSMSLSKETVKRHLSLARKFIRTYMNQQIHPFVVLPVCIFLFT
jgi:RNA polymerase sigma-70 factor (ECF subfamily)